MLFYKRILSDDFACFLCHFKSIFWYVHFLYHYYIIQFHYLGWDRVPQNFWRWCAHQAHFLWRFLKFEKKFQILWANPHVFEQFLNFLQYVLKIHFFYICMLCIIIILCGALIKFIRHYTKIFSSMCTQLSTFSQPVNLSVILLIFELKNGTPAEVCACCAIINLSVQILPKSTVDVILETIDLT